MQVNLLLESESRSASPVPLAMGIRLVVGTLSVLILMLGVLLFTSYRALQNNVKYAEAEWARTVPKYKAAIELRAELAERKATLKEIQGWRESRVAWGKQLEYLQQVVPASIQLTELHVTHDALLLSNTVPARVFELRLSGRTGAARSEANVSDLQEALAKQPPFDQFVESAGIPPGSFRQDPSSKSDRVFEIACKYKARPFE